MTIKMSALRKLTKSGSDSGFGTGPAIKNAPKPR